jgi:hypothetical protein
MQHGGADRGLLQQNVGAQERDGGVVDRFLHAVGGGGISRQYLENRDRVGQGSRRLVEGCRADKDVGVSYLDADPKPHFLGDSWRLVAKQARQGEPQIDDDTLVRVAAAGYRDNPPPVEFILTLLPVFPGEEGFSGPEPVQHGIHATIVANPGGGGPIL